MRSSCLAAYLQHILALSCILFQDQVRVIRNLSHLHNKTEDVGIVVEQDTLSDVGVEVALAVGHDTVGKVVLCFTKELAVNINLLDW